MLTMTRLPSDSFLPSSAMLDPNPRPMSFASHLNGHSSASVISPLSLPRALNNLSCLDESNLVNLPSLDHTHSPSIPVIAQSQQQYLSPRPSSPNSHRIRSAATSPYLAPSITSSLGNMSNQALLNLLQRREEQNRKLIENWRAERAHLEASRTRAEEMYQEERAIIDEERMIWIEEKSNLQRDLSEWKKRTEVAEKQRDEMVNLLRSMKTQGGRSKIPFDGAAEPTIGSLRGGGLSSAETHSQSSINFWSPSDGTSPKRVLPGELHVSEYHGSTTMPESKPFIPLDPRMQGLSSGVSSPVSQQDRVPCIDIQEVIPGLEGIRVRPDIVQKATFTDDKPSESSPEPILFPAPEAKQELIRTRVVPAELTKEALQAPESDRLTMHAGHTPNHSISLSRLHTVETTEVVNTADSSGSSTPKCCDEQDNQVQVLEKVTNCQTSCCGLGCPKAAEAQDQLEDERDKDPELKGPLTLRNLPAADEPFLKALNDKLADVITHDMTPTVLKHGSYFKPATSEPVIEADDDGAHDAREELEEQEPEIPLKLKQSSNFGAPLGQLRKPVS
ncbi:hypothetical protein F4813DRAFT_109418 [Daldinia decipiens]|uniref:uncharacterized protein n=1 Tax=Daldinia decipiens TaxID=326647 RepID=UPI0020C422C2|nr:uncharacterized protein F4813DRAFT_109418 [Daldinia decipiens]KAI1662474.1 hypothetical protein F4813DRAFT_109418 [Daldinia decipiens]